MNQKRKMLEKKRFFTRIKNNTGKTHTEKKGKLKDDTQSTIDLIFHAEGSPIL